MEQFNEIFEKNTRECLYALFTPENLSHEEEVWKTKGQELFSDSDLFEYRKLFQEYMLSEEERTELKNEGIPKGLDFNSFEHFIADLKLMRIIVQKELKPSCNLANH